LQGEPCPGVVLVLQDVTELRRLEHLRQEFVANVSHELKTPLAAIKACAETLQDGAIDRPEVNREFTMKIEHEADRLNDLIVDMLRLAKIESGHEPVDLATVSLQETTADCVQRHLASAKRKDVKLVIETSDPALAVRADRDGVLTILDNLVDNALKYTDAGGLIKLKWTELGKDTIQIDVADNGAGIPDEHQSRVFERFYRVDQARSRELGSTGLGLAIVKHLSQSFGGTVSLDSQPGKGSTFRVSLPKAQGDLK
jgi:two-component system phosphate regulon sensor histidine kinase PhoR